MPLPLLTLQQRVVLGWLCEGDQAKQIADKMGISINSVRGHIQAIKSAFGTRSQTWIVYRTAYEQGHRQGYEEGYAEASLLRGSAAPGSGESWHHEVDCRKGKRKNRGAQ